MNNVTIINNQNGNGATISTQYVLNGKQVSGRDIDRAMTDTTTAIEKEVINVRPGSFFNIVDFLSGLVIRLDNKGGLIPAQSQRVI